MAVSAILDRELRMVARRSATYRLRATMAAFGLATVLWLVYGDFVRSSANAGNTLLWVLTYGCYALVAFLSVTQSADSISSEKREGTIVLLALTRLTPLEIVLGKWFSAWLSQLQILVAIVPLLVTGAVVGGVRATEVVRLLISLAIFSGSSTAIALLASTLATQARAAQGLGGICVAAYALIGLSITIVPESVHYWLSWTPSSMVGNSFAVAYEASAAPWRAATAGNMVLLVLALCAAAGFLPQAIYANHAMPVKRLGSAGSRVDGTTLEADPCYWLALHRTPSQRMLWLLIGSIGLIGLLCQECARRGVVPEESAVAAFLLLAISLKLWAAGALAYWLAEDKESGALELILTTPLPRKSLLEAQFKAFTTRLKMPALVSILLGLLVLCRNNSLTVPIWLLYTLVEAVLVADLFTLSWVGMWTGLTSRRAWHSTFITIWRVILRPFVILLGLIMMSGLGRNSATELLLIWVVIGIINNLITWVMAYKSLYLDFAQGLNTCLVEAHPAPV